MKKWYKTSPEGTRDLVFSEAENKIQLIDDLRVNYICRGYSEILTPSVEFYDLFTAKTNTIPAEMMYKLTDRQGRLIVLRPDNTAPIARVVSTRLQDAVVPIKLHYTQNVLRQQGELSGMQCETTQSGVELIGAADLRADLEVLYTAVTSLMISGVEFKLEIGHVGFFNALVSKIPFTEDDFDKLQTYIEYKNYSALLDLLALYQDYKEAAVLAQLPSLFGDPDVLKKAAELTDDKQALECLNYLLQLHKELEKLGIAKYISIDLGLVLALDYYTGLVFKGYAEGAGSELLSGGRYDKLYAAFGNDRPAVGFAINVDLLSTLQRKVNGGTERLTAEVLIRYEDGCAKQAYKYLDELLTQGVFAEIDVNETLEQARAYAFAKGIGKLAVVTKKGRKEMDV